MNEDNGTSGSGSISSKKRGPTVCKKLKKRIANQKLECTINFDEYGQPCGDMLKDFTIYLGSVVRFQVDINLESWDAVNQGLKDVIWDDIKSHWKLDDSRKKIVLEKAAKHWRDFKGKLTKNFLRAGKDPCEVYHFISREQWETYKKRRESEEFKAISEKAKQSQKHNEHVHFLGSSGYRAKRTKWCIEDPIANLENLESLDSSILSKLQKQVSDGSWTPQGHDDILSRALGRKEHGGRVRGVGGGAKIKDVFGSGKSKQSGVISMDELATITQEITKKVQKECDEKMEMMNTKLHGIFQYLKQMGLSLPENNFMDDIENPSPGIVRSSCQSVGGEDHISEVSVDDVVPEYQLTPLPVPCSEHETIGNAEGSFVQWPKELVNLGQLNDDTFAFMSPSRLVINHKRDYKRIDEVIQYMTEFLVANKDKRFIFAPYIQDAFKLYVPQGGRKNNRKEFLWYHTDCPQQLGGTECGFFIMRYMYEIITLSQKNPNTNWKELGVVAEDQSTYSDLVEWVIWMMKELDKLGGPTFP
ncbi:hypothetical protein DCAR_0519995 [Daucus carota subsp. sativus]|uniref:DUF8039 domain-containing protein n=1 Tax=Daucus carota subsp. sativus TaxID=79200 RepID=A0AAF0X2I8_DAUCS|nr:hypothetical protein DCAR_0519995 [Daucus carota subsp. sativus]